MTNHAVFIWCVKCKTTTVYAKVFVLSWVESTSVKRFLFSICWKAKTEFSVHIFQLVLVLWENCFLNKPRVEPTIFLIEKISLSLKLFSGHFYGQSFIKTVQGPFQVLTGLQIRYWPKLGILMYLYGHFEPRSNWSRGLVVSVSSYETRGLGRFPGWARIFSVFFFFLFSVLMLNYFIEKEHH